MPFALCRRRGTTLPAGTKVVVAMRKATMRAKRRIILTELD